MIYLTDGNMPLNNAYSGKIVQEDGSTYQLTFRFPTSDVLWEKLKEETFLTADDLHGEQDFVIFEVEKKNGYIQVYANQVFTLLNNYVVNPISLDRVTGTTALSRFAGAITRDNPFSFFSDISERHTFNTETKNAMQVFAKDKHSILGQWGGDLVRHGYQVRLLKNGGSENESLFMYKKNLSSYQHKTSTKSLKTRITFKATVKGEGENAPDRKFSVVVDSPLINKYSQIYEDVIEVNDQDVKDEASLRKYGEQYFKTSLCDMMEDSLELEVVGQSDVPVQMYDIVSLFHEVYNLDVRKKITKYTYSPMAKKLLSIGFGQFKYGLANAIGNAVSDAVRGEAQQLHDDFEKQLERELKNADRAFEHQKEELVNQFTDGLNAAKAKAEEVKAAMTDQLNLKINQSKSEVTERLKSDFDMKLATAQNDLAGVRANLTQAQSRLSGDISQIQSDIAAIRGKQSQADNELAKQVQSINQAKSELAGVKTNLTQAQSQLSSNIAQIRSDVGSIRTKQGQHETEIGKQVQALNAAKNELAGVKSAQATFEQSTQRRLAELANVADGKANKAELLQTAEQLASKIASVQVGGVNLFKGSRDFSGSWSNIGHWTRETEKYKGLTVMSRMGSWLGLSQPFEAKKGETYTFSFYIKSSAERDQASVYFVHNSASPQARVSLNVSSLVISSEWQRLSVTFKIEESGFILPRIERFNADNRVYVAGLKLERGTIATDYSENPEDVDGRVSAVESSFKQRADSLEAGVSSLREGLSTKADSSALTVLSDSIKQSVKSLETNTDNKLNQKLSTAEFDVRASGIRQEILNATKDKADKTLVTAEAGRLREELASLSVGENLFINSEFKNLRDNGQRYTANGKTYQNMIAPYWYNPYNAGLPNAQNIQHGYFDTETFSDTVFAFNESDGSRHWKALSTDFKIGVISAGEYYFSADLYAADLGTYIVVGFYYHDASGRMNFYSGRKRIDVTEKGRWTRLGIDLKVNDDIDLTKKVQFYIYGYNFASNSILYLKKPKVSKGRLKSDWSPALEDTDGLITEAKATFERTAQGLRVDLAAVQAYVSADGTRSEALRTYSREETARQLTAERKLIDAGYVGKATYAEDVKGISRRFEELKTSSDTKLAEYKQGINGQLASVQSALNTANGSLTSFNNWKQSAQETLNKVGRVETGLNETKTSLAEFKQTAQGLRTDLSAVQAYVNADGTRSEALRTYSREETARQLTAERKLVEDSYVGKAAYAEDVKGISRRFEELKSSSETKLAEYRQTVEGQFATMSSQFGETIKKSDISITPGQIVLGTGKVVNGQTLASLFVQNPESMQAITKLMRITGDLIVDGSITGRDLAAGAITTPHLAAGAVTAEVLGANAVTADKVKADDALLEKLSAGEALLRKLMAKDAFINRLQSVEFTANQIRGGVLGSIDGTLNFDLNKNTLIMGSNTAAIKRVLPGHPTQFMRYETERKGNVDYTRTIIGSNRNGSEKFDSVTFAGLVVENSNKAGVEDSLRLYGDNTYFRHAQGEVGWNINAVTQRMSPATWQKESAFWARSFVVPKHRNPNGRDWVKLEETVAALWRLWEHAAGNQVTMTGAMRDKVRELFQNYGYNYGIS